MDQLQMFVLCCAALMTVSAACQAGTVAAFQPQTRVGFTQGTIQGDQWEPSIAADAFGHTYILFPEYTNAETSTIPGCATCPSPTMFLVESSDNGKTWSASHMIANPGSGQVDVQIKVDPLDGRTVYASWLQNNKSVIAVSKSIDFGATWSKPVAANSTNAGTDKDILVVKGTDVYVGYNHAQTVWVSSSHDGGARFTSVKINQNAQFGWSLAGGAAIDNAGNVYFSWEGYTQNGGAKGPVNIYVSKSSDGGAFWSSTLVDVSGSPPDCSAFSCGWAFLGPGAALAYAGDKLHLLWNSGPLSGGPERMYYSNSPDGMHWSPKLDVTSQPRYVDHAFPAIATRGPGDVRIAWMDQRAEPHWNVYYRSSTDGGNTWSAETKLSTYIIDYSYIFPNGFRFPFGDYFDMAIDYLDHTQTCWGEGYNWLSPGSIWFTRQLR